MKFHKISSFIAAALIATAPLMAQDKPAAAPAAPQAPSFDIAALQGTRNDGTVCWRRTGSC